MTEQEMDNQDSVFDERSLQDIYDEIKNIYSADRRPWVIGYSGGKDSTTALQLTWNALAQLPPEERQKPVYVISSDTLVEAPSIVNYVQKTLTEINEASDAQGMPFRAQLVTPEIDQTFWVNLIGRGYPAPQRTFRWCTDRLKIKPADSFIVETVNKHGECILVLGVRRQESMTRAQVMKLMKIKGSLLSRHSKFAGVLVYTPIEDFSLDDVWTFLLQTKSPWGGNNRDLAALYRDASGECPLVVDTYTPSCGGGRFGCWTCTVVDRDKSMESMIDSGQDWMQPLLDYRDFLSSTQDPEKKHEIRDHKRRDGNITAKSKDPSQIVRGPYKFEFCKVLLRKLLETEAQVREKGPDPNMELIRKDELEEIRRIWRMERGDWEDSVPTLYEEVTGRRLDWIKDDLGTFTPREAEVLEQVCADAEIPPGMVIKLLEAERQTQGMSRRSSIYTKLDRILREDWREEDEVLAEFAKRAEAAAEEEKAEETENAAE